MDLNKVAKNFGLITDSTKEDLDKKANTIIPQRPEVVYGPKDGFHGWHALSRPVHPKSEKQMTRTLTVIGIFIGLLALMMQSYFFILVVVSIIVLQKALRQTPPEKVHYEISTHGIKFEDALYKWQDLENYFIKEVNKLKVAVVSTKNPIPGRLYLTYIVKDEDKLIESLGKYLIYLEEEPKTYLDKAYDYVMDKINLGE